MDLSFIKNIDVKTAFVKSEDVETHEKDRAITHFISTPDIDWGGDIVDPKGMNDSMFKKHNTVFYNHDYNLPIAKNLWLKKSDDGVLAKTQMGKTLFADDIYQLQKDGIINSWSIGWRPAMKDNKPVKDAVEFNEEKNLLYIHKWDLVEYSVAPLAMNPNALDQVKIITKSMELKNIVKEIELSKVIEDLKVEHKSEMDQLNAMFAEQNTMVETYDSRLQIMEAEIKLLQDQLRGKLVKETVEILGEEDVKNILSKLTGEISR